MSNKHKLIRATKQNLTSKKDVLHHEMCFIDFVHAYIIFLVSNDKAKQILKSKKLMVRNFTI